ncbi:MAG TPA: nitronate monooxygenase [Syntrophales bacterium]|nr:nitronate monooxygenase [Syntrophales bacterium]
MISTRLTKLLGIRYPILMGAMHWVSNATMVAAIAEAGGIGFLPTAAFKDSKDLRAEIGIIKGLTDGPIGLNISMLQTINPGDRIFDFLEVGIDEKVAAFETAGRAPVELIPRIKEAGIPLIHKVPQVKFAKKAQDIGVDAVTVVGYECGGFTGMAEITSLVLINKAARTLDIPVIAGGGIVDGRGLVAALALGAEGVLMGTRFMASEEAPIHPKWKERLVDISEGDTTIVMRSVGNAARVIRNAVTERVHEIEMRGGTLEELMESAKGCFGQHIYETDDVDRGIVSAGEGVGLINGIKSIQAIVDDIVTEAEAVLSKIHGIITPA